MANLQVDGLTVKFGGITAVSDLSFRVGDKQFVGLMGPNGAGKSTVINAVSRVYKPANGKVTFDGVDLLSLKGHELTALGISRTFQDLNFFNKISDMSIIEYLKMGDSNLSAGAFLNEAFQFRRSRTSEINLKKRGRRILEFMREMRDSLEPAQEERGYPLITGREGFPDLIDVENSPINILSFAWRRRLDLARALVSKPKLLLLDEPAQGLPPSEIENLGRMLKMIQSELGISALIVEHNIATLSAISDRIVAMDVGQKISEGTPSEVNSDPRVIEIYLGKGNSLAESKPPKTKDQGNIAPLLELRDIDLFYGAAQALFSVSVKIFPKQVVSILGTNGSGKSTILKVIGGTEKPANGEMIFEGEQLPMGWPEISVRRGIQFVPQGHLIFPELTVKQNLKIGTWVFKDRKQKYKEGLERIFEYFPSLKDQLEKQAASLSGGQQQMLAIAQALMGKPKLLLLDEPSLGLSPILVDSIFEIIRKISENERCGVLLVEQNVKKALEVSDYVFMLNAGIMMGQGSTEAFLQDNDLVKKYLGFS